MTWAINKQFFSPQKYILKQRSPITFQRSWNDRRADPPWRKSRPGPSAVEQDELRTSRNGTGKANKRLLIFIFAVNVGISLSPSPFNFPIICHALWGHSFKQSSFKSFLFVSSLNCCDVSLHIQRWALLLEIVKQYIFIGRHGQLPIEKTTKVVSGWTRRWRTFS